MTHHVFVVLVSCNYDFCVWCFASRLLDTTKHQLAKKLLQQFFSIKQCFSVKFMLKWNKFPFASPSKCDWKKINDREVAAKSLSSNLKFENGVDTVTEFFLISLNWIKYVVYWS